MKEVKKLKLTLSLRMVNLDGLLKQEIGTEHLMFQKRKNKKQKLTI